VGDVEPGLKARLKQLKVWIHKPDDDTLLPNPTYSSRRLFASA
jgi:hypothetical protein